MTDKQLKLVWVPAGKAKRTDIPFTISKATGRMEYNLPADLSFGHVEFQGVNISGYFQPSDDEFVYTTRPWAFD